MSEARINEGVQYTLLHIGYNIHNCCRVSYYVASACKILFQITIYKLTKRFIDCKKRARAEVVANLKVKRQSSLIDVFPCGEPGRYSTQLHL